MLDKYSKSFGLLAVCAIGLAGGSSVMAATVGYTVTAVTPASYPGPVAPPTGAPHNPVSEGGDGLGYPGDSVGLATFSGTLDLTPGTYTQKINTLNWSISYTYNGTDGSLLNDSPEGGDWPDLSFPITAGRTISFGGGTPGAISQTGLLKSTWDNDFLSLNAGSTSTFFIPGYQIDVTPLAVAETGGSNFTGFPGGTPWAQPDQDVLAQFVVTAVPEPTTLGALALGGVALLRRRRA